MKEKIIRSLSFTSFILISTIFIQNCDILISSRFARIAFSSNCDNLAESDIYTVHENGYGFRNITNTPGIIETNPVFSPDGMKIAYVRTQPAPGQIFVINTDGSGSPIDISKDPLWGGSSPQWAPDGTKILFTKVENTYNEIYITDSLGIGAPINLSNTPSISEYDLSFSPDGTKIAYMSQYNIYIMESSGNNKTILYSTINGSTSSNGTSPSWSPDGKKIAFISDRPNDGHTDYEIYTADIDGTNAVQVTHNIEQDNYPVWSPNSKRIAFRKLNSGWQIYVVNSDGSNDPVCLTPNTGYTEREISWSPDGRELLFETDRDTDREIYIMNSDGTNQRNISNLHSSDEQTPVWWFR